MHIINKLHLLRPLHGSEREFLRCYFGAGLQYDVIRVGAYPFGWASRASSPWRSSMMFPRTYFIAQDPNEPLELEQGRVRRSLVHEAIHAWQRQQGRPVTGPGLLLQARYLCGADVYAYDTSVTEPLAFLVLFLQSNIEQQGRMVEDFIAYQDAGADTAKWKGVLHLLRAHATR